MKMKGIKIGVALACLVLSGGVFMSCHKGQPSWNTQVLAPLVSANLSINDIITSKYISSNPDSTVSLVYIDSLYNISLVKIPDTTLFYDYVSPVSVNINPGGVIVPSHPTTTKYATGTAELNKAVIQSGYLNVYIINALGQTTDYSYTVPNVTKNSVPLQVSVAVTAHTKQTLQIDLSGYTVDFTGPTHNSYNEVTTDLQINLDASASSLTINPNDTVGHAQVTFSNIVPYYAKGYFGDDTTTYSAKQAFPVFSKIVAGTLSLQNCNVNLSLTNGVGVDARLTLKQLSSYNSNTNNNVDLIAPGLVQTTLNINRATETHNPSAPVNPTVQNFALNPGNSNILTWLDNMPTSVGYNLHVETDPLGNVSGNNDFVYYGYGISAVINVTIPLSLIANNLTLADTMAVNFGSSANASQHVKSGTLTIYANNGFPFSAGLQMLLLNDNNIVTDSIFIPSQTIAAGNIDAISGKVTSPQNSVLAISLDAIKTQELFNTKNVILYAKFNMGTLPSTYMKIYNYYKLGLKVVGNFEYQVN